MTREYRNKVFGIIYHNIFNKHPDWSQAKIRATTVWCLKRSMKPKMIKRCNCETN